MVRWNVELSGRIQANNTISAVNYGDCFVSSFLLPCKQDDSSHLRDCASLQSKIPDSPDSPAFPEKAAEKMGKVTWGVSSAQDSPKTFRFDVSSRLLFLSFPQLFFWDSPVIPVWSLKVVLGPVLFLFLAALGINLTMWCVVALFCRQSTHLFIIKSESQGSLQPLLIV